MVFSNNHYLISQISKSVTNNYQKKYKIIFHNVDEIQDKKTKFMTPFGSLCSFGLVLIQSLKGR